jgi:ATP-dependent exoDNAse (exonuclease V) alpha subunit
LLYTAITRAKAAFCLIESGKGVFEAAVARRVERYGGLAGMLSSACRDKNEDGR